MHFADCLSINSLLFTFPLTVSEIALSLLVLLVFVQIWFNHRIFYSFNLHAFDYSWVWNHPPLPPPICLLASPEECYASTSILGLLISNPPHPLYSDRIKFFKALFTVISLLKSLSLCIVTYWKWAHSALARPQPHVPLQSPLTVSHAVVPLSMILSWFSLCAVSLSLCSLNSWKNVGLIPSLWNISKLPLSQNFILDFCCL